MRNWLMDYGAWEVSQSALCKFEAQKSLQCSPKAWEPENQWCRFQSESKRLRPGVLRAEVGCLSSGGQANQNSNLSQPVCSIQALPRLGDAQAHCRGPSAFFSPPIQMLISSSNTLMDTPRNNVESDIWAAHGPVNLTHKINYHRL